MGRLVDADTLVKIIDRHTTEDGRLDNDITCILEEVPTAYDVEKTTEQVCVDCYTMGFDESQTEIIVNDIKR